MCSRGIITAGIRFARDCCFQDKFPEISARRCVLFHGSGTTHFLGQVMRTKIIIIKWKCVWIPTLEVVKHSKYLYTYKRLQQDLYGTNVDTTKPALIKS